MNLSTFGRRLSGIMPRMMFRFWTYEQNYFTTGRISFPQLWALGYLAHTGPSSMRTLARTMRTRESTTTGLVDRMARMGLVERKHSEKDRRVVYVDITARGRRILNEINRQREATIRALFGRLSSRDRTTYLRIVEKLVEDLPAAPHLPSGKERLP